MKPAPPVTKMVCRINISLPQGDQHAGMPRCCHLPGKRSIVIKKDGLSPSTPRSSISCLAGFYLSRPPLVRGSGIHHTPAWFLRRFCHSFPAHRIKINLLNIRSHLGPKILFADYRIRNEETDHPCQVCRTASLKRESDVLHQFSIRGCHRPARRGPVPLASSSASERPSRSDGRTNSIGFGQQLDAGGVGVLRRQPR